MIIMICQTLYTLYRVELLTQGPQEHLLPEVVPRLIGHDVPIADVLDRAVAELQGLVDRVVDQKGGQVVPVEDPVRELVEVLGLGLRIFVRGSHADVGLVAAGDGLKDRVHLLAPVPVVRRVRVRVDELVGPSILLQLVDVIVNDLFFPGLVYDYMIISY